MNAKEICNIREWAPLTVIEQIPGRIQKGLFPADLNLTCVDATDEFLALGSDAGIVFWFNRQTGDLQKLRTESSARINCVKIVNSVEYMIAAGSSSGLVNVFQVHKEVPEDLNLIAPCTKPKPIQRYTIRDLHESGISCCEWSKNGMKLYSGDKQGIVVLTEFDYQNHLSKSIDILRESYEIVQLNVFKSYLLVSTLYRNIICQKHQRTGEWQITQVGKKERKYLADCGGVFLKGSKISTSHPLVLCSRPGLRFWLADTQGNVQKTLIFKEAIQNSPLWEIPILNPKSLVQKPKVVQDSENFINEIPNFHSIYLYNNDESMIVTHDKSNLYLLNLEKLRLEAIAKGCRKISDLCVNGKEILILEGERSLIRLAPMPEKPNKTAKVIFNPAMPPPVPLLGSITSETLEAAVEYGSEEQSVTDAEECFELPPIQSLTLDIPIELAVESPKAEQSRRLEIFRQISEQDFDAPIVHHSELTKSFKKKRSKSSEHRPNVVATAQGIVEIAKDVCSSHIKTQSNSNSPILGRPSRLFKDLPLTNKPTELTASFCLPSTSSLKDKHKSQLFAQHLPDMLSPTSLQKTIAAKAEDLAKELDLPQVCLAEITSEELKQSQAMAAPPPPPLPSSPSSASISAKTNAGSSPLLSQVYPTQDLPIKDELQLPTSASAVTSPPSLAALCSLKRQTEQKKSLDYANEENESGVYSDGQPIDELCSALALIVKNDAEATDSIRIDPQPQQAPPKSFIPATLNACSEDYDLVKDEADHRRESGEIKSFLLDFNKAKDPFKKPLKPRSSDSNSSSEWEFLDN